MKPDSSVSHGDGLDQAMAQDVKNNRNSNNMAMASMACVITMLAVSTVFMTQPVLPEIAETFGIHMVDARFSFTVASFFYAAAFFIIGPAIDLFNLPRTAVTGLVLLSGILFWSSCSRDFTGFVASMGGVGFSAALIPSSMFPYMSHIAPDNRKGIYIGAVIASATTGIIVGRVLTGGLTGAFGWQTAFRLIALMLFIIAVLSIRVLGNHKKAGTGKTRALLSHYKDALTLLRDKHILMLYAAGFLLFFGFIGVVTFLTYRLSGPPFNYTSEKIGWISFAGITALIAPFSGELSKKIGIFHVILPGMLLCIIALQLTGWFTTAAPVIWGLVLLFLGVYSCQPLIFLLVADRTPTSKVGFASSFYILSCIGGGSVSTLILGPVWDWYGWDGIIVACSLSLGGAFIVSLRQAFRSG